MNKKRRDEMGIGHILLDAYQIVDALRQSIILDPHRLNKLRNRITQSSNDSNRR
jgi:hypothetical protein